MVCVLNKEGKPLMPTKRHRKVRLWLKNKQAKVVRRKPFTIQLLVDTTNYVQEVHLGIDSGFLHIGVSALTDSEEVLSMDVTLLNGMVERNQERSSYRRVKRSKLRYRKPRFDHRKRKKDWLAPSIEHKLNSHIRLIELVKTILPVTQTTIEVANFDIQKILKPGIKGKEYQEGVQKDFFNLREYILFRDHHQCQNPGCTNKSKNPILMLHHIVFESNGGSNSPNNLITLCECCHTPANHKKGKLLDLWQTSKPKLKPMKDATFMNIVRWRLVNELECKHTYGYLTKSKRIALGLEKSHVNDAFVVAGGADDHKRSVPFTVQQVRRNNRSLDKFYDAKFSDARSGEKVSGQELFSGRTKRNKTTNTENLRQYRQNKVSKGRRAIRKERYPFQPKDLVLVNGVQKSVVGTQNKGAYVKLRDTKKVAKVDRLTLLKSGKGFCFG